jgi:hypothetical protein
MAKTLMLALSVYQTGLVVSTAKAQVPMVVLPVPDKSNDYITGLTFQSHIDQANDLVAMGIMEHLSSEFSSQLNGHFKSTGRRLLAYGLTEAGYTMFNDSFTTKGKVN